MNNAKKIVLAGILCAIALILLFFSSIFSMVAYCLLMAASLIMFIAVIEIGRSWAFLLYAAISILAFLLIPLRNTIILYIFLLGYYPIVKSFFEQLKNRIGEFACKILLFNVSIFICIFFFQNLFLPQNKILTNVILLTLIIVLNIIFILYDIIMTRLITLYLFKVRSKLKFIHIK